MSLDSIVRINISSQSLHMAQAGFGVPLIMGEHDAFDQRVQTYRELSDLPMECKDKDGKILQKGFKNTDTIYKIASALTSQKPTVDKFKIGRRAKGEDIVTAFDAICTEDSDFYGLLLACDNSDTYAKDITALSAKVASKRILLGIDLDDTVDKDLVLAADLKSKAYRNVFSIHKPDTKAYPAAAWMGKMLPRDPGSATWAYKQLMGISPAQLSSSTIENLRKNNVNYYIGIKDVGVTIDGKVASGEYIDVIVGIDWLHVRLQERLFRLLAVNQKIPYTLKGIDLVRCEIMAQLKEAIAQGVLAANPEPHVSTPTIDEVSPATREHRILPKVKFSGRLAGAIHHIHIEGTVGA
jgi:hypothetical protein